MNTPIADPIHLHVPKSSVELRTITEEEAGQRVDNFLMRHFKTVPRSRVYRLLRKGEVRVNRKRVDAEYRLAAGDEVRLPPVRIDAGSEPGQPSTSLLELIERSVIFQDKHVLVIDKPAGVAVHGGSGLSFGVIEALRASRPRETLELVHRLDRDTSGCLLIARDRATLVSLHALIRDGGIHKTYLALVSGSWQLGTKRIDAPLATDNREHGERHVRVASVGKDSVSIFKPVQFFGSLATLMEVDIPTGRTHQIRVHASFAGHPLLGDDKYGDRERNAELKQHGLKRTFLHAQSVAFEWPGSGVPFHVSAPLPAELSAVIDEITPMKRKTPKTAVRGRGKSAGSTAKTPRTARAAVAAEGIAVRAERPSAGGRAAPAERKVVGGSWASAERKAVGGPRMGTERKAVGGPRTGTERTAVGGSRTGAERKAVGGPRMGTERKAVGASRTGTERKAVGARGGSAGRPSARSGSTGKTARPGGRRNARAPRKGGR